jgi:gas vesicle protein
MEDSNGTFKIIGALLAGAVVGATIGVLFAPEKGSKTRSNILGGAKDLASDFKKKIKEEAAALRQKAEDLEHMAKDKAEDMMNDIKDKAENAMKSK